MHGEGTDDKPVEQDDPRDYGHGEQDSRTVTDRNREHHYDEPQSNVSRLHCVYRIITTRPRTCHFGFKSALDVYPPTAADTAR